MPRTGRAILCQVADRHGVHPSQVLADIHMLSINSAERQVLDKARIEAIVLMRDELNYSFNRIANVLERTKTAVWRAYQKATVNTPAKRFDSEELEAHFRLIAGTDTAMILREYLDATTNELILLAVVINAYPRWLDEPSVVARYEEGVVRILNEMRAEFPEESIKRLAHRLEKRIIKAGIPAPFSKRKPSQFCLTDEFALWCHNQFGRPVYIPAAVISSLER